MERENMSIKSSEKEIQLARLWVNESSEADEIGELLIKAKFLFVSIPVSGISRPELVVGMESYVGIEEIKEFLRKSHLL